MSDAKPYSAGDVPDTMACTDCGEPDCCLMEEQSRIIATVEALEKAEADLVKCIWERDFYFSEAQKGRTGELKAEAERDALYAALSEAGISHGGTVEGLRQGLSVVARLKAERDEWRQRCLGPVDDAEASRVIESIQDVAKREVVVRLVRERDEARETARFWNDHLKAVAKPLGGLDKNLRELPGLAEREKRARLAAEAHNAALREALETLMVWHGYEEGTRTNHDRDRAVESARAALAATDKGGSNGKA